MAFTATYSPEDNKLRLYASARLDAEAYARVRAAGFIWAPKQELFVAPMWTPERADLLTELAGEIGDEDTSLVERAEERADRFGDYSAARADDAKAARDGVARIADGIPLGQPILVGHHSERHARKDAERIENGMRRAVKMWEQSGYWKSRAAGAIAAAKYKERPDVRARRIKGLEADLRKQQKIVSTAEGFLTVWSASLEWDPEVRRLTVENAKAIANYDHISRCFPLANYPRNPPASQYEGSMGLWSALEDGIITPEQARDIAIPAHRATIAHHTRWVEHYSNRLEYERAMLAESGGTPDGKPAAAAFDLQPDGKVLVGRDWYTIVKVNRKGGEVVSVSTNSAYCRVKGLEEIREYEAPTQEAVAQVAATTKQLPLVNYRAPGCVEMTSAEWKRRTSFSGSSYVSEFNAQGGEARRGMIGEGAGVYRQRAVIGPDHGRRPVFLTDAKETNPPGTPAPAKAPKLPVVKPTYAPRRMADSLEALTDAMFEHYDSGNLRGGVKYEYSGEGWSSCFQYDTLEALIECARAFETQPRMLRYKLVTHSGEYKNMRTVYSWERADHETEAIKGALAAGVQVVTAPQLFPTPPELAARMVREAKIEPGMRVLEPEVGTGNIAVEIFAAAPVSIVAVEINRSVLDAFMARYQSWNNSRIETRCADFLQCNGSLGFFDRIVMNPPFSGGADILHIRHAREHLKTGGILVSLCANGPRQQAQLKPMAESSGGYYEPLPAGTFAEAGTGVNVALLVIQG